MNVTLGTAIGGVLPFFKYGMIFFFYYFITGGTAPFLAVWLGDVGTLDAGAMTHTPRQINQGLWLGLLGIVIFAVTLPMTRLAVGTPDVPQMSGVFVAMGRAVVAAGLGICTAAWMVSATLCMVLVHRTSPCAPACASFWATSASRAPAACHWLLACSCSIS